MAEINLLQNSNIERTEKNTSRAFNVAGIIVLAVVIVVYAVLFFLNRAEANSINSILTDQQQVQQQVISNSNYNDLLAHQSKLSNLQILLDKHLNWGALITDFSNATLKTASYDHFQANSDGSATISGKIPDFQNLDKMMQAFQLQGSQYIKDVKLLNIGLSSGDKNDITFTVNVTFNNDILQQLPANSTTQ